MISITRLLCEAPGPGDHLRYQKRESPRPVVVWNCTRQCNLRCVHCYASAGDTVPDGEMDTAAGKALVRDLAAFDIPVILFSGGEPLLRHDLFELAGYAAELGVRIALSTNGTLITPETAARLRRLGFAEVGISLDGVGANNDRFRGKTGAYQAALEGIRNCVNAGLRVSLRLTITRFNYREIPSVMKLAEAENIDRICFYHLAYSGRGGNLKHQDITPAETRAVVEQICRWTLDLYRRGLRKEVLTVGNHADGIYLYLELLKSDPARAAKALELLKTSGGNASGIKIGAVDNMGDVHPDQFWWHHSVGNVRARRFGDIWTDAAEPVMAGLRDRKGLLRGRCARCRHLDLCNGNLRVRAEAVFGDVWGEDPACYLTEEEIAA